MTWNLVILEYFKLKYEIYLSLFSVTDFLSFRWKWKRSANYLFRHTSLVLKFPDETGESTCLDSVNEHGTTVSQKGSKKNSKPSKSYVFFNFRRVWTGRRWRRRWRRWSSQGWDRHGFWSHMWRTCHLSSVWSWRKLSEKNYRSLKRKRKCKTK